MFKKLFCFKGSLWHDWYSRSLCPYMHVLTSCCDELGIIPTSDVLNAMNNCARTTYWLNDTVCDKECIKCGKYVYHIRGLRTKVTKACRKADIYNWPSVTRVQEPAPTTPNVLLYTSYTSIVSSPKIICVVPKIFPCPNCERLEKELAELRRRNKNKILIEEDEDFIHT